MELVFVLGHPHYYARHGFNPAAPLGFTAPYPIPEKNADAWMVRALKRNVVGSLRATVVCAKALDKPEYWRE
jgi:putative acetyltransferase